MGSGLYDATTAASITGSHRQIFRARAVIDTLDGALALAVTSWEVTAAEDVAPRWRATLVCVAPEPATRALLDPRAGVRVELDAGYVVPGGTEDVQPLADLALRKATYDAAADQVTLELASDESLVIDASPGYTGSMTGTPLQIITNLIKSAISPAPRITSSGPAGTSSTVDPVTDKWATLDDQADLIGADVYDDGTRAWMIAPRPITAGTSDHILTHGTSGTTVALADVIDRDAWCNYVTLRYRWRSGTTDSQIIATAYVSGGGYAITGPAGKRSFMDERTTPTTQAAANTAAATVLTRALTRGRSASIQAISAFWLRPGSTVAVDVPGRRRESQLVSRISWTDNGLMTLSTRVPEVATVALGTTTPTSSPGADPAPAASQRYVSSWVASSSATYRGTGVQRSDTTDMVQGPDPSGTNGNGRAMTIFTGANSTGDESAKTVTQALTGAKVVKVEIGLWLNHSYFNAGGRARVGFANATTAPATLTSSSPYITSSTQPKGSRWWINITSAKLSAALLAGTCRAITIGQGSGYEQYCRYAGATDPTTTHRPVLRITYSK